MNTDNVVIVLVLGLFFLAISYYLYSRIGQLERKTGLMENILLDLKVTTEQALISAIEPQVYRTTRISNNSEETEQNESEENDENDNEETRNLELNNTPKPRSSQQTVTVERDKSSSSSINYEGMTYKELVQLAKNRGISGTRNLSKAQVIDLIRRHISSDSDVVSFDEQTSEGTNLTDLLSAQPANGAKLEDADVDTSLVQ